MARRIRSAGDCAEGNLFYWELFDRALDGDDAALAQLKELADDYASELIELSELVGMTGPVND